jgi:hypothetical protein
MPSNSPSLLLSHHHQVPEPPPSSLHIPLIPQTASTSLPLGRGSRNDVVGGVRNTDIWFVPFYRPCGRQLIDLLLVKNVLLSFYMSVLGFTCKFVSTLTMSVPVNSWIRWEFVTTLDFEWEVYCGRRPWRWSFIVYVTTRVLALLCFLISLVGFNLEREFNCNVNPPIRSENIGRMLIHNSIQAWLRFVLVRVELSRLAPCSNRCPGPS